MPTLLHRPLDDICELVTPACHAKRAWEQATSGIRWFQKMFGNSLERRKELWKYIWGVSNPDLSSMVCCDRKDMFAEPFHACLTISAY